MMDLSKLKPTLRADGRTWVRKRVPGLKTPVAGYGSNAEEAINDLREKLTLIDLPQSSEKLITLHDLSEQLWTPHIEHLAPATHRRYESCYVNHIRDTLGHHPLSQITALHIRAWLDSLKDAEGKELSSYTKSYALDVLTNIFGHAVKADLLPKNPCSAVSFPRPCNDRERILDLEGALTLLESSRATVVSAPVFLATVLGLRRSEIAGLKWEDLSRKTGELRIRRQREATKGKGVIERELKTKGSRRTLYLPKELIEEIDKRGDLDSLYVTTFLNQPWIPDRITEKWTECRKELKLEDWKFHDLRRLAAGLLVAAGCDLTVVAAVLGHSKPDMSAVYVSVADSRRKEGIKALASLLGRQPEQTHTLTHK